MSSWLFLLILILIYFLPSWMKSAKKKKKEKKPPISLGKNINESSLPVPQERVESISNIPKKEINFIIRKIDPHSDYTINHLTDYIVLDVETTGLSKQLDRIIEIGAVKISNGEIVDEFSTLVNPEKHISEAASAVNGIYDEDVKDAPKYRDIVKKLSDFLIGQTILGYNVSFDLGFIGEMFISFGIEGNIQYFDVLSYAKRVLDGLPNYKLTTVASYVNAPVRPEHRATEDAKATNYVFEYCRNQLLEQEKAKNAERKKARELEKQLRQEAYHLSPLYDVKFCFTGIFSVNRSQIENMAATVGGLIQSKVNSATDYLVVGDISTLPEWAVERKFEKAKTLQAQRKKVKIINEEEYIVLISEAEKVFKKARSGQPKNT